MKKRQKIQANRVTKDAFMEELTSSIQSKVPAPAGLHSTAMPTSGNTQEFQENAQLHTPHSSTTGPRAQSMVEQRPEQVSDIVKQVEMPRVSTSSLASRVASRLKSMMFPRHHSTLSSADGKFNTALKRDDNNIMPGDLETVREDGKFHTVSKKDIPSGPETVMKKDGTELKREPLPGGSGTVITEEELLTSSRQTTVCVNCRPRTVSEKQQDMFSSHLSSLPAKVQAARQSVDDALREMRGLDIQECMEPRIRSLRMSESSPPVEARPNVDMGERHKQTQQIPVSSDSGGAVVTQKQKKIDQMIQRLSRRVATNRPGASTVPNDMQIDEFIASTQANVPTQPVKQLRDSVALEASPQPKLSPVPDKAVSANVPKPVEDSSHKCTCAASDDVKVSPKSDEAYYAKKEYSTVYSDKVADKAVEGSNDEFSAPDRSRVSPQRAGVSEDMQARISAIEALIAPPQADKIEGQGKDLQSVCHKCGQYIEELRNFWKHVDKCTGK